MKTRYMLLQKLFGLLTLITMSVAAQAQDLDKAGVKALIEGKEFVFKAQTALPLGGTARQLSSDYDVRLYVDSMVTYLPYFGRAFSAPPQSEGAINFTSKDFTYTARSKRKGWEIRIEPKDGKDVRSLQFSISESGYGTLQVISNSRQAISFNGFIKAK